MVDDWLDEALKSAAKSASDAVMNGMVVPNSYYSKANKKYRKQ